MRDYRVKTKVNILTGFPSEEFNSLMFESAKQNIVNKITDIIKSDEVLPQYIEGDLLFRFYGYKVCLRSTGRKRRKQRKWQNLWKPDNLKKRHRPMKQKKSRISLLQILLLLIMIVCLGVFCYEMVCI